jgi:phosphoglycerol transferase MdoB-like AlkP superfamily enzyme
MRRSPSAGGRLFRLEVQCDAKLVAVCGLLLTFLRVALFLSVRQGIAASSGLADAAAVLLNGLRFDGKVAASVALPSFALSLACLAIDISRAARRVRAVLGSVFACLAIALGVVDLFYFQEFHAQFDRFVLGAVYDDLGAVMVTIWKTEPVIPALLVIGVLAFLAVKLVLRCVEPLAKAKVEPEMRASPATGFASVALTVGAFAVVLRGSLWTRPVQAKDAAVTTDPLLNELVVNPFVALHYAIEDWRKLAGASGLYVHIPDGDVRAAARRIADPGPNPESVDDALARRARGSSGRKPRHVFLIVEESFDAWTLDERYAALHLADETKALGRDGILVDRFVSAANGTMGSFAAIVTGLADAGVFTNYQASARTPYPSSIAPLFASLGYRTRVFYGGYLSWQRIGDFCRDQGFDEVYGAAHMATWSATNEWGVSDEDLFTFVERTVPDDVPSFDVVLTTSNHPPYDVDVWAEGWPVKEIPGGMEEEFEAGRVTLREIGHHAYADRVMGWFVRSVSKELDGALFAVTGDHFSRKFPGAKPTLFQKTAVPLLLYGPSILAGVTSLEPAFGSHLDIVPTLAGFAAPEGFEYHSIGRDLFDPRRNALSLGPGARVITADWIADLREPPTLEAFPGGRSGSPPDLAAARVARGDLLGLSWWRIVRGGAFAAPGVAGL